MRQVFVNNIVKMKIVINILQFYGTNRTYNIHLCYISNIYFDSITLKLRLVILWKTRISPYCSL